MTPIRCVKVFHVAFGHPVRIEAPAFIDENLIAFRLRLIREEAREFDEAVLYFDSALMLDALSDILYVVCGAAWSFGLAGFPAYAAELDGLLADAVPDVLPVNLRLRASEVANRIDDHVVAIEDACAEQDVVRVGFALTNLYDLVVQAATILRLPLKAGFEEAHRTNMLKLGPDGKPIYRESDGKVLKPEGWTPPDFKRVLAESRR